MGRWWAYVVRTAGTDEQKAIAEHSGIGTTVMSRWFKGKNDPSAKLVVTFARAYKRPPVEALVAAGYLSENDATDVIRVDRELDVLTDDELLSEVRRRMHGPSAREQEHVAAATVANDFAHGIEHVTGFVGRPGGDRRRGEGGV